MSNQWELNVKDFGRIKEANIIVSPFMLFVGKNNSGKTYLMMLLWGILTEARGLIRKHLSEHPGYHSFMNTLMQGLEQANEEQYTVFELNEAAQDELLNMFNDIVNENKEQLLNKIFRFPVRAGSLKISRNNQIPFYSKYRKEVLPREDSITLNTFAIKSGITFQIDYNKKVIIRGFAPRDEQLFFNTFLELCLVNMICSDFNVAALRTASNAPLYFPASRTGFLQTYRAIIGSYFDKQLEVGSYVMEGSENSLPDTSGTELTLPVAQFLSRLQRHDPNEETTAFYQDEIHFLNSELLDGRVEKGAGNQFRFKPGGGEQAYPLHVTSSLVAEVAPLSIFLTAKEDSKLWIIEEVESHLHSELQRRMVRFLFRLINKGKSIWMTTHSDNLAQQINNLLAIAQHKHKDKLLEKLNYTEQDIIKDLSIVNAYQFEVVNGITEVTHLPLTENGFVMDTFNDTLVKLVTETDLIQNFTE
ncbi:AAA family ATPase [Paenibacillus sp. KS-LC4]|uniref:AAA family ATPase n=1 Tax=Paenibacillus sp. KS-LC4 TaxID=2979727 RepID=UPI0030D54DB7